jgi:hypothetical protein
MLDLGATTSYLTRNLAIARIAMSTTGQNNSQREDPRVLFHTIQFFFMSALK